MNRKQKLGYTLLGAGIMAVGIAIGQFVTPDISAQSNGVFDKITCRRLLVVDENGNKAITLAVKENGNYVNLYDSHQRGTIVLAAEQKGGALIINNPNSKAVVSILADKKRSGIGIFDKHGKTRWLSP